MVQHEITNNKEPYYVRFLILKVHPDLVVIIDSLSAGRQQSAVVEDIPVTLATEVSLRLESFRSWS
jgi:hypothetical protein